MLGPRPRGRPMLCPPPPVRHRQRSNEASPKIMARVCQAVRSAIASRRCVTSTFLKLQHRMHQIRECQVPTLIGIPPPSARTDDEPEYEAAVRMADTPLLL